MELRRIGQGETTSADFNINNKVSSEKAEIQVPVKASEETAKFSENQGKEQDIPSKEATEKAVNKLNKFLEGEKVHAEYQVHEKFGDIMIKIVNNETKEVILEIPPKKILDMVAKMLETVGIWVDEKA